MNKIVLASVEKLSTAYFCKAASSLSFVAARDDSHWRLPSLTRWPEKPRPGSPPPPSGAAVGKGGPAPFNLAEDRPGSNF